MTAWLDAALPPLDPTIGLWLLFLIVVAAVACAALDLNGRGRRQAVADTDPYGEAHGDVTRRPDA